MNIWDCNVLLLDVDNWIIFWGEVKDMVLLVYDVFLFEMVEIVGWFFDNGWIDVLVCFGKVFGVFVYLMVFSVYLYVFLNY